jgi:hypothetical protein
LTWDLSGNRVCSPVLSCGTGKAGRC